MSMLPLKNSSSPTFQTAYGSKLSTAIMFPPGHGRTKQSHKAETDINNIMSRYQRTGTLDFVQKNAGRYGDTTGLEFQAAMDVVAKANSMFAELPSSLRSRFNNRPEEFLDFVQDDRNIEEARKLGLLKPEPAGATPPAAPRPGAAAAASHEHVEDATTQNRTPDGQFASGHEHKDVEPSMGSRPRK